MLNFDPLWFTLWMQTFALISSKIWYHLLKIELSILRNYQQTPSKIKENQDENKNRNNKFYSHDFIHLIAHLMGPLSISTF